MQIDKELSEMSYEEFKALTDYYIEHSAQRYDETPTSPFFEMMFNTALQRVQKTTHVTLRLNNGELNFVLPVTDEVQQTTIQTRGNQILVGNKVIVVTLEDAPQTFT